MNLLNLLIQEKSAVGVELNDLVIRVAYFRPKKKFLKIKKSSNTETENVEKELILIEEPIPSNIISNGAIADKDLLTKILKNIWKKEKLSKKYAIVSIPEDRIYTNLFPFPKTVTEDHLKQAVELAIDFQLPYKKNEVYIGWESSLNSRGTNEVLISTINKNVADEYIKTLNAANIDILALESHVASIARSIQTNTDEATLVTKENGDSVTLFVLKNNTLKFSRTLPSLFIKEEESLVKEISKTKNSFETEYKEKVTELPLTESTVRNEYRKYLEINNSFSVASKWLIPLGSAIRGEIKRGNDNQISLLPISTEEAYKYQKIKTFITLIRNISIGISIFFLIAFLGAYFFIFSLSQTIKNNATNVTVSPISWNIAEKEALIQEVNSLTALSSSILSTTPSWSILIDEINSRIIPGIIISSFSAQNINEKISITGTAGNRDTLNKFKKVLEESTYLTTVELPITNLEQKADIPFSITFKIKDPSMLYYK